MFDPAKLWPLGLNAQNWRLYRNAFLLVLLVLLVCDESAAHAARDLPAAIKGVFTVITRAGRADWILFPALILALAAGIAALLPWQQSRKARLREITAVTWFVFVGVGLPGLAANLVKRLVGRARPVHLDELGAFHFEPVINGWSFQSFPSGDTTTIFAFAASIAFLEPKLRPVVALLAILVGSARLIIGMHYPTDVWGGFVLGTLGAYAVRNYWLSQGWLFEWTATGAIRRKVVPGNGTWLG